MPAQDSGQKQSSLALGGSARLCTAASAPQGWSRGPDACCTRAAKASPSAVPSVPRLSPARRSLQALPLLLRCRPAGRLLHAHGQRAGRQPVDPVTPRTRTRVMSPGPRGLQSVACFFGNLHIDEGPCLESYFSEVVPSSPWYFLWSPAPTSSRCLRPLPASHAARLAPLPW